MAVYDQDSGEQLRIAKITPQLARVFDAIEIDTEKIIKTIEMLEKNPNIKLLINNFNLSSL